MNIDLYLREKEKRIAAAATVDSGGKKGRRKRVSVRERKEEWIFSEREWERERERGKHMKAGNWTCYKDGVGLWKWPLRPYKFPWVFSLWMSLHVWISVANRLFQQNNSSSSFSKMSFLNSYSKSNIDLFDFVSPSPPTSYSFLLLEDSFYFVYC